MTRSVAEPTKRIAALDLGTNSFHALIVDIYPDASFRTIDKIKEMVLLAEDGFENRLSEEAIQRGIEALKKIGTLCEHQGVEKILAYATSAIREAENGGAFIQQIIDEVGIKPLAISGKMEAELIAHAVQHGIVLGDEKALLVDIGGGSVEFTIADGNQFYFSTSKKLGVARMTATYVDHDPIKDDEITALRKAYEKSLEDLKAAIRIHEPTMIVGSSGTMENISEIIAKRKDANTSVTINEFEYSAEEFLELYNDFIGLSAKKRRKVKGLDSKRVDIINPGMVLVKYMIETFGIERFKTSSQALREGMILRYIKNELKEELQLLVEFPNPRERSVYELLRKTKWHATHSRHVAKIGRKLFDKLRDLHELGETERELFYYACLMHDIGYYISHRKHHKHALYLIRHADLMGFTEDEIEIMANVARYHRRSTPKSRHKYYKRLDKDLQQIIRKLSGLMRVADGLDRSHYQNVTDFDVAISKDAITLRLHTEADPHLEIWGAMRKRYLLEEEMDRELHIEAVDS